MSRRFLTGYAAADGTYRLGLQTDAGLHALYGDMATLDNLLQVPAQSLMDKLEQSMGESVEAAPVSVQWPGSVHVWAGGLTYGEQAKTAERPPLFHKALGSEVVEHDAPVGIRFDAALSIPEAELAVVLNHRLEVVGFTLGNDMTARDIVREDVFYLAQAKVYYGSCALGPRIWLQPGAADFPNITIRMTVEREGDVVFTGETQTRNIKRPLASLVDYLGRCKPFPEGVVLLTGSGINIPMEFSLVSGDVVRITAEPIGALVNPVRTVNALHGR